MDILLKSKKTLIRIVLVDVLLLAAACLVPAFSHALALPLYKLNPMLMCLLASLLLVGDRRNGYLVAALLPLTSMLLCGMPLPLNAICMTAELLAVVAIFDILVRRTGVFVSILSAILAGKVVFYALKALLLTPAVLIGTSVWLQLATTLLFGGLFALLYKKA